MREAGANVEINETRGTIHGYDSALNTKIAMADPCGSGYEAESVFWKDSKNDEK